MGDVIMLNVNGVDYICVPKPADKPPTPVPTMPPAQNNEPPIPANAVVVDMLAPSVVWKMNHDPGTPGNANGTLTLLDIENFPGALLQFNTVGKGGMIYHAHVTDDWTPYNRFAYIKIERKIDGGGWATLAQCETDLEATDPVTGIPYDMAIQQNANDGELDVTKNHKWTPTGIKMNPELRSNPDWHTTIDYVGIMADNSVFYHGVTQDGKYNDVSITTVDAQSKPWTKKLLNMQLQYNGANDASTDHVIQLKALKVAMWKV